MDERTATINEIQNKLCTWKHSLVKRADGLGEYKGAVKMIFEAIDGELEDMKKGQCKP